MADIKVIYKNVDGFDQEHSESADSVKMLSFKTANKELTDTKLSHLIDGVDATDEHIHDARYFRKNEHIAATTGVSDAGKSTKTDATGYINPLINVVALNSALLHDSLPDVANSTAHTKFITLDGTRDLTGVQKYASLVTISDDKSLAHKKYVDDSIVTAILGQEWYKSANTRTITPPSSPTTGQRFLIDSTLGSPTGVFVGKGNQVAEWSGSAYFYQIPTTGTFISVDDEPTVLYNFGGAAWSSKSFEVTTASTGLIKVGNDIRIDAATAGNGLGFSSGILAVNVDASSIEINSDILRIKALGIKSAMIDFGVGLGQIKANALPITDVGNYFPIDDVESALQNIGFQLIDVGIVYTAETAIAKGDLVYISSNDKVSKYSSLSSNIEVVGIAMSAASIGQTLKVKKIEVVLPGVLTGATAGVKYYWSGSALVTAIPSTSGQNVWLAGEAKNATDLNVFVSHVKKNA